jgi:pyruvate formate-lyase activating enzyme-like uncharacterized protein
MKQIEKTPFYSKKLGELSKGCQMCVKGEKLVLYITGICPRQCWYCPLSEKRKDKDVIFVNEWKTEKKEDLFREVELCQSKGAGITGGDPLSRIDRTAEYIKLLKDNFGKGFHIHLYTSFILVNKENLQKLYDVGLDEIRFHPDYSKPEEYKKINLVREFDWDIGIEIPAIPKEKKEIFEMIDYMDGKIDFLNLNEFEISDLNSDEMEKHGYSMKSDISHGISGSLEFADDVLEYCKNKNFNVHSCSSTLKDRVQMQNRFKLRAEKIKTKYDIVSDEGLLIRGVIYLKNKFPKEEMFDELRKVKKYLEDEGLEVIVDEKKFRFITYPEHVEQFAEVLKELNLIPVIIEEDPTVEAFEVNRDFL